MNLYLHDIPFPEAIARFERALHEAGLGETLGIEEIPLDEYAIGRVLTDSVWAKISSPHYHSSAMDGFAICATDSIGANPNTPMTLSCISTGGVRQATYLDTGDPLPEWADAVIPIENVESLDLDGSPAKDARNPACIRLRSPVAPWQYIRPMGEDMVATQLVLPAGTTLRAVDLGAIAASGHDTLRVARKPRVAIIPTGSELVPVGQLVKVGEITEFNSIVLAAQVNSWGGSATRFPIIEDKFDRICKCIANAACSHDLIVINAGSSMGSEDYTARVIEALGEVMVHGVAIRPGHPVILGMITQEVVQDTLDQDNGNRHQKKIPIVGVPGYPVSAALTGEIFIEPLLAKWLGRKAYEPVTIQAALTRKVTSPPGDDDYLRVVVGRVGETILAAPLARGSGVISSLVRADGIAILPRGSQGAAAGAKIPVRLYRSPNEIDKTIFAIGSHDLTLDLMAQYLAKLDRRLVSANVGSQGGLIALHRGEAHLAGSHLLDPNTGEYNISYIYQYLPGIAVKVIALVGRQQGLIIPKNNSKYIFGLEDLRRPDIRFINRQRGAGTRQLLDYHLDKLGISPDEIMGYQREEYTHLAVAATIASGRADCGLGVAAAAQALNLDFIPLFRERYDLVIPEKFYESDLLIPLQKTLADPVFHEAINSMPGYDISNIGEIVADIK